MGDGFSRQEVRFNSGGSALAAWLYLPTGLAAGERRPAIVMAHGWSAVKEMHLDDFGARFARDGFAVVVFDYRNFGASGGAPRQHIDPALQLEDYRNAITWARRHERVDPARIGIWGSSFSGAHVLHLGAYDRRVRAVVAQVPLINGLANFRRLVRNDRWPATHALFAADREQEAENGTMAYLPVVAKEGQPSALPTPESFAWMTRVGQARAPAWRNTQTLRSLELALAYDPGSSIHLVSPTPLLMIVAAADTLTPTDLAVEAYRRAREPKALAWIQGGHFDAYDTEFERSSALASDWFRQHLLDRPLRPDAPCPAAKP